jgi:hypothetical protein
MTEKADFLLVIFVFWNGARHLFDLLRGIRMGVIVSDLEYSVVYLGLDGKK